MSKKTAIDLLKERLLRLQSNYKEGTSGHNCFGIAAKLCDEYKEEEKQQVKNDFNGGYRCGEHDASSTNTTKDISEFDDAENYYKDTYATS